ncbi:hypothetical protein [Photorhabdus bodei]|nr:hypothetical protein [Photorhabdus bodei]
MPPYLVRFSLVLHKNYTLWISRCITTAREHLHFINTTESIV